MAQVGRVETPRSHHGRTPQNAGKCPKKSRQKHPKLARDIGKCLKPAATPKQPARNSSKLVEIPQKWVDGDTLNWLGRDISKCREMPQNDQAQTPRTSQAEMPPNTKKCPKTTEQKHPKCPDGDTPK